MKLEKLANELHLPAEVLIRFISDFELNPSDCITKQHDVKDDFEKFARENTDFLKKYDKDLKTPKSVEEIASILEQPNDKIAEIIHRKNPPIYDNGMYKSSVSTFAIDYQLGGNYQFMYDYFGKKTYLNEWNFIGYRDIFFFISRELEPFISSLEMSDWGLHKPVGIILYGPPGSGKIFWARKIAEIIGYQFKEVKKHYMGTSFINGTKTNFNDFLVMMMKDEKVLLFMEDFDTIMSMRNDEQSVNSCDEETKEIVLHYISHFEEENLLMVGSANSTFNIDREIMAPGRFDVRIPIFPPNVQERCEMLLYHMIENLTQDSLLMKILVRNDADHLPFWQQTADRMKAFSNTMIIDFTQSLKKKIRNLYLNKKSTEITIDEHMMNTAFREASFKLTEEYLTQVDQFIVDVSQGNYDDFPERISQLKTELESYKIVETPRKSIGFAHNSDQE
ncbi:MAG: AAA family ATPase [Chryseobacterium sp. 39-10]|nr:ATP-binding protein [Chryseobacterium sp.]OJV49562.1 MAG: AAA family ATPase [Chryseobacterium sp. 39-10]